MKTPSVKRDLPRWLQLLQVSNPQVEVVVGEDKVWAMLPDEENDSVTIITEEVDGEKVRELFEKIEDLYEKNTPEKVIERAASTSRPAKLNWYQAYSSSKWIDADTPIADAPQVEVQPYGNGPHKQWAVMLDGALLCLCTYQRGAVAVKRVITEMGRRYVLQGEQLSDCKTRDAFRVLVPGV